MEKLALQLPGGNTIPPPTGLKPDFQDLASLITPLLNIIFYLALFLTFYYLIWGALSYIMAQGQKENLAKARARITWALIGLMVTLLAFFIAKFIGEVFTPKGGLPF
ncbi:hypothetical protein A2867_04910 [Candidatus Daviesbacteria bacterium RIFCSPHIGHO2_01_FULL_40_11]|uniref:Uncharacterized protein n=1 Tax=Candidatus Daviesbacteria bacterium RIFCSPHIGHO2_01_FULL_40_11 TaxID=1797762 RepID=A0A1F5JI93_9BACT|nr:MAG: hypothetical protein A2867_04910 [Candidatus Daviesbacteria bacterium RIFCSPHIGHO2_01_FULL_40_11]OGE62950.1 MAG: hypothetical protein A2964_00405 [Candidatus Daviesbacteria bacterium RIFCSPLOWO2_01_FULL_40_27]